ncbi:ATP-binding protein [Maribacter sp. ACAM166]|uniref:ATP-binding protein n=1 Tax=Maribacter sp. ACAM166 TaxID=2508996 RepID=UPI0010FD11A8|nr:ATP-binding protein [Maribacter sp. ACAM166]TLP80250.1 hypothetical protein ES765_08650 [Maribacter sp. ACAM166]
MKPSKKTKRQVIEVYNKWLHSYLNADVTTYDSYFDDAYHFIGSTLNEEFLNRASTTQFFAETADQLAGKCDLRNETLTIEQFGELIFITHVFDAWFKIEKDWNFYGRFRFSSTLQEKTAGWRFIYQHFSTPDTRAEEGETIAFEKINTENQELRHAVKRRTLELEDKNRELEVEGALGRIRTQAIAMKQSSDLLNIVVTMRNEFIKLGHEAHYFWHMMWLPKTYEKAMTSGDGSKIGFVMELPRHIHGDIPLLAKWEKSKESTVVYAMDAEEAIDYVDKMVSLGDFKNIDPQAPTNDDIKHIGGLTFIMARTSHGEIGYSLPGVVNNSPKEDIEILIQFAKAFDLAHQRFLDLQKSEKQAREVQIELSLEKVRSRTMAMQHSDELAQTSFLLDSQVRGLGIKTRGCAFNIYNVNDSTEWFSSEQGTMPTYQTPRENIFLDYYEIGQSGQVMHIQNFEGEDCAKHYEYMCKLPVMGEALRKLEDSSSSFPANQIDHVIYFKYGYLLFITLEPVPEAHDIFKRFAKVFEQTYTRFLDLQKAESQAREAQIETALEKVRSRTMAMQKGEELQDVVVLLYKELIALGVTNFASCGYVEINEKTKRQATWVTNPGGDSLGLFHLPLTGDVHFDARYDAWKKQQPVFHQTVAGKERRKHLEYAITTFNSKEAEEMVRNQFPDPTVFYCFNFSHGYLHLVSSSQLTQDEENLLARFTRVFEQTYARFLDLQKAEAQAREAQIENALEKVRSRTMAMQHSNELPEAANDLFLQVQALGIPAWSAGYCIWDKDKKNATANMSSEGVVQKPFVLPIVGVGYDFQKPLQNGESFHIDELGGDAIVKHYEFMRTLPIFGEVIDGILEAGFPLPTFQIFHIVYFDYGYVMFITYETVPKAHDIFKRFGKVFEQTYTRFLDLQKAEAQTKEAQIEAALETVRSRSLSMQKPDELQEVVAVVSEKLKDLGIVMDAGGVIICTYFKDSKDVIHWIASPDYSHSGKYLVPYFDHQIFRDTWESKNNGDEWFSKSYSVEEKNSFFTHCFEHSDYKHFPEEIKELVLKKNHHTLSFAWNEHSAILVPSHTKDLVPSQMEKEILIRFAKVFEQAYIRFMDLQVKEEQSTALLEEKQRLEKTLKNLQETQKQLIQAEKMASLGELTAGIAHEIQNPLNFVNNFSEVSNELIDEMNEELDKGDLEEVKAISLDIKQNLEKINHHGKRAEGIVKGMLQHSRTSTAEKEPTDINKLADEYLRLAYHGLRAKDKSFNAELITDFDENIGKVNVIPQDMGRVILNLITNAFYAVNEKSKSGMVGYQPTVTVSTKRTPFLGEVEGGSQLVQISISDNGNGIPKAIVDKIFQPFFTTKPTGQGTGLGLSMSYDIVTKGHGGELKVETNQGAGTTFIIDLPIQNKVHADAIKKSQI